PYDWLREAITITTRSIQIWSRDCRLRPSIEVRVADLTSVRLPEGFVCLACLLDIYSRTCIGWSLSRRIDAQLPLQAACDGHSSTGDPSRAHPSLRPGKTVL